MFSALSWVFCGSSKKILIHLSKEIITDDEGREKTIHKSLNKESKYRITPGYVLNSQRDAECHRRENAGSQ